MERVAFLLPEDGRWVHCLLNPETLIVQRQAGVRHMHVGERPVLGSQQSDDSIVLTGGGRTHLQLDLLFDVELAGRPVPNDDVRNLSDPLWHLADSGSAVVRMVWGKHWNQPGVFTAAAQRFDRFLHNGTPRRNWMRLQFQRVAEEKPPRMVATTSDHVSIREATRSRSTSRRRSNNGGSSTSADGAYVAGARIDLLAAQHLGDASRWRELAQSNNISDPLNIDRGQVLRLPGAGS